MPMLDIQQFICLKDNYGVLIRSGDGSVISIDAPDAAAVLDAAEARGWGLTHILNTHHHGDHTAGNLALKARTRCKIIGPAAEADRIPGIDTAVKEGDALSIGGLSIRVLETPGHTLGHVVYWLPDDKIAFVGDTLFAMGCGRVLEGTPELMWRSLERIAALPPDTTLYCGHEYTVQNARFGMTIEPWNKALERRLADVEALRAEGKPTLPTRVDVEIETNVFLRAGDARIRRELGMGAAADWRVFAEIRERKNRA
ncbi:MAG: hydroxyacylglutathione hydrolase [Hyphomicrobium sp.]|nr:hydroxyacylglutathione hydrolase [Hyphomicrobium sp.]